MSGLFLSFDSFFLSFPLLFLLLFCSFLAFPMSKNKMMNMIFTTEKEIYFSMPQENTLGQKKIILFLFFLIFSTNFLSLFSHYFSGTALLSLTMSMSLSFFGGVLLLKFNFMFLLFVQGLTPSGTPLMLMSFMVLIELTSQMIRPITLMVRLAVNLMTGHLILSLMSSPFIFSFFSQLIFFLLEMMVSLVQAYVFSLLLMLYLNE